ncbi:MAG TPA: hypothetical protein VHM24_12025 [Gemmatimonadaceae bacterium]|nr:hypothetical protein [Gemmatimonadaceae bacterium]
MNSQGLKRALDGITVILVAAGGALWLVDKPLPTPHPARPAEVVKPNTRSSPADSAPLIAGTRDIIAANIFSPTRAAPAARYTPNAEGSAAAAEPAADAPMAPPAVPPRVFGTMTGPAGSMALIQPDSAGATGRLYREGERVGPFRIEKILKASVVMRGPSGRVEVPIEQRDERSR